MDNTILFFQIFNPDRQSLILDKFMTFGAKDLIYLVFLLVFLIGIRGSIKEKKSFLLIVITLPIAVLLIKIIHLFFFEQRPFVNFHFTPIVSENTDASFPSRHATLSAVIAFAFTYFKSKWSLLFLLIMLWIGFSRIFVGVHYPLDILGGFVTAIIALKIALLFKNILKKHLLP